MDIIAFFDDDTIRTIVVQVVMGARLIRSGV